ncbi:hypothetical protein [Longicatena caecimuris]
MLGISYRQLRNKDK